MTRPRSALRAVGYTLAGCWTAAAIVIGWLMRPPARRSG